MFSLIFYNVPIAFLRNGRIFRVGQDNYKDTARCYNRHRMEEAMRNQIKIKIFLSAFIGCILFFGAALSVFAAGTITVALSSETVKTGDAVTVTIYAENANGEEVSSDFSITYDASKLEYVSSSATSATGGGGTVKVSGSGIDVKFKAIGSGDAYVKAEGAALTAAGAHIMVSGTAAPDTSDASGTKSGDNSLSSLKLSQGTLSPAFKGSVTEYTAEVGSDVNEITVTPVTSNSKAAVESITGNKDLKSGSNVISVVVKAENGTTATYKITVTKKDTPSTSSGSAGVSDIAGQAVDQMTEKNDGEQTPAEGSGDSVVIDGVNYKISGEFSDDVIPEGFGKADFEYKGNAYQGIMFDKGYLGMYYLINDAGEGKFFIYDANRDSFYPYVRLTSGEHYVILMTVPNGVIPPDNYKEANLTIGEVSSIPAYQYAGSEEKEIVKIETEDGEQGNGASDFYILYGMDASGVTCWYQYDVLQGTYQRFNEEGLVASEKTEDYEALSKSYKELDERQKATKVKDRRIIAVLIFVSVVLLIVIINLFLKVRDLKSDDMEKDAQERPAKRMKAERFEKFPKPVKKIRPEKKERPEKKTLMLERESKEDSFYDGDDADIIDEFEEEPSVLGRRTKKKVKPAKTKKTETVHQETSGIEAYIHDDDDDLEFLDLNDL